MHSKITQLMWFLWQILRGNFNRSSTNGLVTNIKHIVKFKNVLWLKVKCINFVWECQLPGQCSIFFKLISELLNFNWQFFSRFYQLLCTFLLCNFRYTFFSAQFSSFVKGCGLIAKSSHIFSQTFNLRMFSIFAIINVVFYRIILQGDIISLIIIFCNRQYILHKLETCCLIHFILIYQARKIYSST